MNLTNKDGEVILEDDEISLKITTNRDLYRKRKGEPQFTITTIKLPKGKFNRKDKEDYLWDLRKKILEVKNNG